MKEYLEKTKCRHLIKEKKPYFQNFHLKKNYFQAKKIYIEEIMELNIKVAIFSEE